MTDLMLMASELCAEIGADMQNRIEDLIAEFDVLRISEDDRLSALAGTIATIASSRYAGHGAIFIGALRDWALEIALQRPPFRLPPDGRLHPYRVKRAQTLLLDGIAAILRRLLALKAPGRSRILAELELMARLLGRYDAASIHLVVTVAGACCDRADMLVGDSAFVVQRDAVRPLSRSVDLAVLAPRGTA